MPAKDMPSCKRLIILDLPNMIRRVNLDAARTGANKLAFANEMAARESTGRRGALPVSIPNEHLISCAKNEAKRRIPFEAGDIDSTSFASHHSLVRSVGSRSEVVPASESRRLPSEIPGTACTSG